MEIFLRVLQVLLRIIFLILRPILKHLRPRKYDSVRIPPFNDPLLKCSVVELVRKLKSRKLTSRTLVDVYIQRIEAVNKHINAVVQERYEEARKDATAVDNLIRCQPIDGREDLFKRKPLLGIPFSVKEACSVKDMKRVVSHQPHQQFLSAVCRNDSDVVKFLRDAGAIPLVTTHCPDYCVGLETFSSFNGKCMNPFDSNLTAGGSSGGEAALHGAGASLFGIGSDLTGSLRIPCMFNGVFGHKPTAGIISVRDHFPLSNDIRFEQLLQIGPITRFAADLPLLLWVISGKNSELRLNDEFDVTNIKIFYSFGFIGLNGLLRQPVDKNIVSIIELAVTYFEQLNLRYQYVHFNGFDDSLEIAFSSIPRLEHFISIIDYQGTDRKKEALKEFFSSLLFESNYTKESVMFELYRVTNGFMSKNKLIEYKKKADDLKKEIVDTLGKDGVLFFPTFPTCAFPHHTSLATILNVDYSMLFNVLGLPATHIPMGFNDEGMPIGFQVIAAPKNDRLCLKIAEELDKGFNGGWVPPWESKLKNKKRLPQHEA